MQLVERIAIVTGASRGIGRAIALELGKRGATIIVNYNANVDAAQEVVKTIEAAGGRAVVLKADVSKTDESDALIQSTVEQFGRLDILVNNAGIVRDSMLIAMKEDAWDAVIDTNLKSVWNCSRAAVKVMIRKRYGRIINISSVSGIVGQAGNINYSASKAGMNGFTKALAREVGSRQITVNAVAPGFIDAGMSENIPEAVIPELKNRIVLGRLGAVEDVAYAVAFLASTEASYITGQVLSVDGGLGMA